MSVMRNRALRAGLEGLERRETPSTHSLASNVVSVHNSGAAVIAYSQPVQNGHVVDTITAATSKTLGSYTSEFDVFYVAGTRHGTGTGTLTAADGDKINLKLSAQLSSPGQSGVIRFTVNGGTGAFANATGHGSLTGHVNILHNFRYSLHAKIRS